MKLKDIISISPDVLEAILLLETKKVPGLMAKNIKEIKVSDKDCCINVIITPFNMLTNIHSLACEVQRAINFYLTQQFDIEEGDIKINVLVLPEEKE